MSFKNDGSFAQDEFIRLVNDQPNSYVWRNRDKKDLMGLNRGRKVGAFPLPADYTVALNSVLMWAEVKSTSDPVRFNYSQIEPGQRSAASISARVGNPYWFFIYSMVHERWFQLSAAEFSADIKAGKKSRRFEELTPWTI